MKAPKTSTRISEEHKAIISQANRRPKSEETKARMSAAKREFWAKIRDLRNINNIVQPYNL